jgi:hypothetical protein
MKPDIQAPLLEIWWRDAAALSTGWSEAADVEIEPQMVLTVGFFFKENESDLIVCSTTDGKHYHGHFQIPKGMIVSRRDLRKKRKPKGKPDASAENL